MVERNCTVRRWDLWMVLGVLIDDYLVQHERLDEIASNVQRFVGWFHRQSRRLAAPLARCLSGAVRGRHRPVIGSRRLVRKTSHPGHAIRSGRARRSIGQSRERVVRSMAAIGRSGIGRRRCAVRCGRASVRDPFAAHRRGRLAVGADRHPMRQPFWQVRGTPA